MDGRAQGDRLRARMPADADTERHRAPGHDAGRGLPGAECLGPRRSYTAPIAIAAVGHDDLTGVPAIPLEVFPAMASVAACAEPRHPLPCGGSWPHNKDKGGTLLLHTGRRQPPSAF